jgi:hypothetical protein
MLLATHRADAESIREQFYRRFENFGASPAILRSLGEERRVNNSSPPSCVPRFWIVLPYHPIWEKVLQAVVKRFKNAECSHQLALGFNTISLERFDLRIAWCNGVRPISALLEAATLD